MLNMKVIIILNLYNRPLAKAFFMPQIFTDLFKNPCEFVKSVAKNLIEPLRYRRMQEI